MIDDGDVKEGDDDPNVMGDGAAVDTVCCFLLKSKLPSTITNVESVMNVS